MKNATLDHRTLARLAATYRRPFIPSAWALIHEAVISAALGIAGGDVHRITTDDGRTLVVHNGRIW